MSCPYKDSDGSEGLREKFELKPGEFMYGDYLELKNILTSQHMRSAADNNTVHDEHFFIVIHQIFELWFKQILYEVDVVVPQFVDTPKGVDYLTVVSSLHRIVKILEMLNTQFPLLETMSPLTFFQFRKYLGSASGFQSLQFRLLENRLGVLRNLLKPEIQHVHYDTHEYTEVFYRREEQIALEKSLEKCSLLEAIDQWLKRTPGLEPNGFNFWARFSAAVKQWQSDNLMKIMDLDETKRPSALADHERAKESFDTLLDAEQHDELVAQGTRHLSHKALQGAMMIMLYRHNPHFSLSYQVLTLLMDIDSLFMKWRYNHVMTVQRMLGGKSGTAGSSGYSYLRSTCGDRYKVFLDLFNLSTFFIPAEYVPVLTRDMESRLPWGIGYIEGYTEVTKKSG